MVDGGDCVFLPFSCGEFPGDETAGGPLEVFVDVAGRWNG